MSKKEIEEKFVKKYFDENKNNPDKLFDPLVLHWLIIEGSEETVKETIALLVKNEKLELLKSIIPEDPKRPLFTRIGSDKLLEFFAFDYPEILDFRSSTNAPLVEALTYEITRSGKIQYAQKFFDFVKKYPDKKILQTQYYLNIDGIEKPLSTIAYYFARSKYEEVRKMFIDYLKESSSEDRKEILNAKGYETDIHNEIVDTKVVSDLLKPEELKELDIMEKLPWLRKNTSDITPAVPNTQETGKLINNNVNISASDIINRYREEQKKNRSS
ncbi:MAG: hypothetical protein M1538_02930 [Candidatus Marsarchaeota archaeon]|nr:hypothetical protein [Candidatus Marsarchaeota archaeon]